MGFVCGKLLGSRFDEEEGLYRLNIDTRDIWLDFKTGSSLDFQKRGNFWVQTLRNEWFHSWNYSIVGS